MEETAEYRRSDDCIFLNMEIIFPHEGFPRSGEAVTVGD